ncbi:unnamed protein product [Closterium sp. NIES-54]
MASRHRRVMNAAVVLSTAEQQYRAADKVAAHIRTPRAARPARRTQPQHCDDTPLHAHRDGSCMQDIMQGLPVVRPLTRIMGCQHHAATSAPTVELARVKAETQHIPGVAAAGAGAEAAVATTTTTTGAIGASGAWTSLAQQAQQHQRDELHGQQRRHHHHHLRIMPPNASGCPLPPPIKPALHSYAPSPLSSPPSTPSFPSSPVPTAASASSSPSFNSASAKEPPSSFKNHERNE